MYTADVQYDIHISEINSKAYRAAERPKFYCHELTELVMSVILHSLAGLHSWEAFQFIIRVRVRKSVILDSSVRCCESARHIEYYSLSSLSWHHIGLCSCQLFWLHTLRQQLQRLEFCHTS